MVIMKLFGKQQLNADPSLDAATSAGQPLAPGTPAPDFTLEADREALISLRDLHGQPVILAFYPADFTPVCSDQMTLYNEVLPMFEDHGAQLLGISVDDRQTHRAFSESRNLRFPLLSDSQPQGEIARQYGVYNQENGKAGRALFVIDGDGLIQWSHVSPQGVNPGADGILNALESLPHR